MVNRRSLSFHPTGSNKYSPNAGVKLIKMVLASDDYLDPSTVKFGLEVVNDDTTVVRQLRPLGGPRMFFRRLRVLCGGQIIEVVDYYNRMHEMFHHLTTTDCRSDLDIEGFDSRVDKDDGDLTAVNRPGPPMLRFRVLGALGQ